MGFHLIDQAACFAVGQPTVRGCTVPNGRSTQGGNSGRGWACVATAATCFWVACMAYPPQRQINGLQRCNSLLCGCQIAVHRLRQLSADGVRGGAVQRHGRCGVRGCGLNGQRGGRGWQPCWRPETWGQHQKKAGRWPWREKRCSWFRAPCRDFETTCPAFSSTKQVDGMLKTRDKTCGQPCG